MADGRVDFSAWRPHPWHGLPTGPTPPEVVHAFIEITPFDVVKYEIDKTSGYLRVDRPQRSSSVPPALYGFVPRTYCGERVRALSAGAARGDGDPLDICVISERPIDRSEVILDARVVGGIAMLDGGEADDKIIAVLASDPVYGRARDLEDLPRALVDRLVHYFASYKAMPGEENRVAMRGTYSVTHAWRVVQAAMADYIELIAGADR
ncbi:MAG: inorganic pyrophosphatase [Planctomycetota bacterium]